MLSYLRLKNCYYGLKQKFIFQDKLLKMKLK